jgi:hypothetical protein
MEEIKMKMWKVRIYNNKTRCAESEMIVPDALAKMIFNNPNLGCSKDMELPDEVYDNMQDYMKL